MLEDVVGVGGVPTIKAYCWTGNAGYSGRNICSTRQLHKWQTLRSDFHYAGIATNPDSAVGKIRI